MRKLTISAFICSLLAILAVESISDLGRAHHLMKSFAIPISARIGIWQIPWSLFSPDPDRINFRLLADITFEDGTTTTWHAPDWEALSIFEHYVYFRHSEYFDQLQEEGGSVTWPDFAAYLARLHGKEKRVSKVELKKRIAEIPHPPAGASYVPIEKFPLSEAKVFYTEEFSK